MDIVSKRLASIVEATSLRNRRKRSEPVHYRWILFALFLVIGFTIRLNPPRIEPFTSTAAVEHVQEPVEEKQAGPQPEPEKPAKPPEKPPEPPKTEAQLRKELIAANPHKCNQATHYIVWPDGKCNPIPVAKKASHTTSSPGVVNNCAREAWLTAVGIPQSQWGYVDSVINGEGGWCGVQRWNTGGSGAYGICQALPASKMASAGADYMTNGLTQLKWCHNYMLGRYGTWAYAAQWKKCVGYCVNSFNSKYTTTKDHTWW
jgi:hypothetical protein